MNFKLFRQSCELIYCFINENETVFLMINLNWIIFDARLQEYSKLDKCWIRINYLEKKLLSNAFLTQINWANTFSITVIYFSYIVLQCPPQSKNRPHIIFHQQILVYWGLYQYLLVIKMSNLNLILPVLRNKMHDLRS